MSELDITKIPGIMRVHGWNNGAALMEKWFAGDANNSPVAGAPSKDIIKMNWVLKYYRAKKIYDRIFSEKIWINDPAKLEIKRMLSKKQLFQDVKTSMPKLPVTHIDSYHIQHRKVGGTWEMITGPLDDLRASLANFVFRVLVFGEIEPQKEKGCVVGHKFSIDEVGIYVRDSYDFNDMKGSDQELGYWDFEDNSVGKTFFSGGELIKNSHFRKWRRVNKKGGDFIVFSDIKYTKLKEKDVLIIKS